MMAARSAALRGDLRHNEPMSAHTSLRVGGPAEVFYQPADLDDLSVFLKSLDSDMPLFWFGLGSNLLVRDGGLPGAVVATAGIFKELSRVGDTRVRAGASLACTQLARQCIRWGLGPSEFFSGIPGTVGGALAMNAGAYGSETWERVASVRTIGRSGQLYQRTPEDFTVGYRSVSGPKNEWFIEATFQFDADASPSMDNMKAMLAKRKDTQPLGLPSCGSVFRNPEGDHAARLIEASGLKGLRIGGAEVSEKHANFIINREDACAADIEAIINRVRETVLEQHGIELICEVRIVGEAAE